MTLVGRNHPRLVTSWDMVTIGGLSPGHTIQSMRLAMEAIACGCVGLSFTAQPRAYAALHYAYDAPGNATNMARTQSGCGLACAGWLDLWGCSDAELRKPYHGRNDIMGTLVRIARRNGAYVEPDGNNLPAKGDVFLLGQNNGGLAWGRGVGSQYEHFLCVRDHDGKVMESVDGGQPGVEERTRTLVYVGKELWCGDTRFGVDKAGRPLKGRRAQGWLSLASMEVPDTTMVPPGTSLSP